MVALNATLNEKKEDKSLGRTNLILILAILPIYSYFPDWDSLLELPPPEEKLPLFAFPPKLGRFLWCEQPPIKLFARL